jgi:hypothetical protein
MKLEKCNMFHESQTDVHLTDNSRFNSQTKLIGARHHWSQDVFNPKLLQLEKIHTNKNVLNMMNKIFPSEKYINVAR